MTNALPRGAETESHKAEAFVLETITKANEFIRYNNINKHIELHQHRSIYVCVHVFVLAPAMPAPGQARRRIQHINILPIFIYN